MERRPAALSQVEVRGALASFAVVPLLVACHLLHLPTAATAGTVAVYALLVAPTLSRPLALLVAITGWACLTGFVTHTQGQLAFGQGDLGLLLLLLLTTLVARPGAARTTRRTPGRQTVPVLPASSVSRARRRRAYALALGGLPALTLALLPVRGTVSLVTDVLVFLLLVVVVAVIGGRGPALVSAVPASLLLNFFFTPPFHTWAIADAENVIGILVFVAVAVLVSWVVDLAALQTQRAADSSAQAEMLASATRLRTALLLAVGHDLRSPLAVAKAGVSGARSAELQLAEEDRGALLQAADRALDRLAGLMDDLLDLSRLQTGAMAVRRRPVAVADVIVRALDDLGVAPRAVLLDVDEHLPAVLADPGLLERVIANLVANAQRFSPPDIPPTVVGRSVGDRVEVRIADRGPGIRAEDRERAFEPFQRLGDTEPATGIGLGLALVRGLAEAMGGTVRAEDSALGGLTMVLSLEAEPRGGGA